MQTRSQTGGKSLNQTTPPPALALALALALAPAPAPTIQFAVDIDFDGASRAWTANKKKQANGCFTYVCGATLKNGNFCKTKSCSKHKPNLRNFE